MRSRVGRRRCSVSPVAGLSRNPEHDLLTFVARRGDRLREHQVDAVLTRCLSLFPAMSAPVADVPRPRAEAPATTPEAATPQMALIDDTDLKQALLEAAMAQPVEDWMTFLHPEQAKHVPRSFNGPARVRGAAGTGKTVVGLHRAVYLPSTRPGRVLYTSYVRTLPVVLREYYSRLSPQTLDRVDFVSVHRFAIDLLKERGYQPRVDLRGVDKAYRIAWVQVGKTGSLKRFPQEWTYWKDEVDAVIKGRGLSGSTTTPASTLWGVASR